MKTAILGSGANGASIGADLTEAGLDLTLIDQWPTHVEAMRAGGVRIEMPDRTLEIAVEARHLCEVAELREPFDLVLVLVKAYDTRWACELIKPLVAEHGLVAAVQNGVTAATVADVVGPERAIGCVIEISSEMTEPAVVHRHSGPSASYFAVGAVDPAAAGREPEVAAVLAHSADTVDRLGVGEIEAAKWMKLVSNSSTLVGSAILGLPIAASAKLEPMRELMLRAGREALGAGAARGYRRVPIFGLDAGAIEAADDLPELLLDTLVERFVLPETTSTVLHDWRKGRRGEVDDINGEVVATLGADAPVNQAIVKVAHRIERGELEPGPANLELLQALAE
ncbi:MAG TPA: 2-dehydropantoate 2-reductase N-terminal domain-containing protein [Solirubrobacterales bacterium]|jgi:2-dehydropantoate 2-reductase